MPQTAMQTYAKQIIKNKENTNWQMQKTQTSRKLHIPSGIQMCVSAQISLCMYMSKFIYVCHM